MHPRRTTLAVLIAGFCASVPLYWRRGREPRFEGHRLSQWVADAFSPQPHEARAAGAVLEEHAVPAATFLLNEARSKNESLNRIAWRCWRALPPFLQERIPAPEDLDTTLATLSQELHLLGPKAKPALVTALEDSNDNVQIVAGLAIPYAATDLPANVEWTRRLLHVRSYEIRQYAAATMGILGPEATVAVPDLIEIVRSDPIDYIRECAAMSIAKLAADAPPQFAPDIKCSLSDPLPVVRTWCAIARWRMNRDPEAIALLVHEFHLSFGEFTTADTLETFAEAGPLARAAAPDIQRIVDAPARFTEQAAAMAELAACALVKIHGLDRRDYQ